MSIAIGASACAKLTQPVCSRRAQRRFYEVATVLQAYEITMRRTYLSQRGTGDLAAMAGEALRVGGYVSSVDVPTACVTSRGHHNGVAGTCTTSVGASAVCWGSSTRQRCQTRACGGNSGPNAAYRDSHRVG